jgi:hypothetical protein
VLTTSVNIAALRMIFVFHASVTYVLLDLPYMGILIREGRKMNCVFPCTSLLELRDRPAH